MEEILKIRVKTKRIPLSDASIQVLHNLDRYDTVVFTSKNARKFLVQALRQYHVKFPRPSQIIQVGPRDDLLKIPLGGKRIFFPRSARAPNDIVSKMRRRGAIVRTVPLYTVYGITLSSAQKRSLLAGKIRKIYFASPSGIDELLQRIPHSQHEAIFAAHAICIGETTAKAARKAGFNQVNIKKL